MQYPLEKCEPSIIFVQQNCLQKMNKALLAINHKATIVVFDDPTNDLETFIAKHKGTDVHYK